MSGAASTGNGAVFAFGPEASYGAGGDDLRAAELVLPFPPLRATTELVESPGIARNGYARPSIQGARMLEFPLQHALTTPMLLWWLHHMWGSVTKTELTTGVYQYVLREVTFGHPETSFATHGALPPVDYGWGYGVMASELTLVGEGVNPFVLGAKSMTSGETDLGPAEPEPANLGTAAPRMRGRFAGNVDGDFWIRISRDQAGGGVQFQSAVSADLPASWTGATHDAYVVQGDPQWQTVVDHEGQDIVPEDRQTPPIQTLFGTASDLALYQVGDIFRFRRPGTWQTPPLATFPEHRVWLGSNLHLRWRDFGDTDWLPLEVEGWAPILLSGVSKRDGARSHYKPLRRSHTYGFTTNLSLVHTSNVFADRVGNLADFEHELRGPTIPGTTHRERIVFQQLSAEVQQTTVAQTAGDVNTETVPVISKAHPQGIESTVCTITTSYDWDPPA